MREYHIKLSFYSMLLSNAQCCRCSSYSEPGYCLQSIQR